MNSGHASGSTALVVAMAMSVAALGACSNEDPGEPGQVSVSSAESAVLDLEGGGQVTVPAGAVEGSGTLAAERATLRSRLPEVLEPVGTVYDVTLEDARLVASVEITLPVPATDDPSEAGAPDTAGIAYFDEAAERWRPVESSYDPEDRSVTASIAHLSLWSAFQFKADRALDAADDFLAGFIGVAGVDQPQCPDEGRTGDAQIRATSDSGDLLKWCVGVDAAGAAVLRIANNRNYALELTYPRRWSARRLGPSGLIFQSALNAVADFAVPPRRGHETLILPGGGTVELTAAIGESGRAQASPSVPAYLLSGIAFGAETLALTVGGIPGVARPDPAKTARAIDLAFQIGECEAAVESIIRNDVRDAQTAGQLFRDTVEISVGCLRRAWQQAYGLTGWAATFVVGVITWLISGIVLVIDGVRAAIDSAIYWRSYRIDLQAGPNSPVAAITQGGQTVPTEVLATATAIFSAAAANDLETLSAIASRASDFTYTFGDPPGDPIAYWRADGADGATHTADMTTALTQSVATDGQYWWWPGEFITDPSYFGFRIGIDNTGIWRFAVAGD